MKHRYATALLQVRENQMPPALPLLYLAGSPQCPQQFRHPDVGALAEAHPENKLVYSELRVAPATHNAQAGAAPIFVGRVAARLPEDVCVGAQCERQIRVAQNSRDLQLWNECISRSITRQPASVLVVSTAIRQR